VALAVVRDNELYVCTVGPAEAYLSRGARLSTLPDPHRDRGLPSPELEPDVWRGEINVGDQLMLVSPNIVEALGAEALKDALVTLHPQSAVEHLTTRFRAGGGTGSDGALVIEAAEIAISRAGVVPVPVRPAEPLAGVPDRSPIPLADTVAGGFAAAQSGARWARGKAGGALYRGLMRIQDALPSRGVPKRRVTPLSARRETQRRAAMAVLSLVIVVGGLGAAVFVLGGKGPSGTAIATLATAQGLLADARDKLGQVISPGVDLVVNDPSQAEELLTQAFTAIDGAQRAGIPESTAGPVRTQIVAALDRLYRMTEVSSTAVFTFPEDRDTDLRRIVIGPDGAPFVLDEGTRTVYRINLAADRATVIFREGKEAVGSAQWAPGLMTVGGRDLLMIDTRNVVWRWQPANSRGDGTTTRVRVAGASGWGDDLVAVGTFIRDADRNLYNLYLAEPSAQQVLRYSPAADGGVNLFPVDPTRWLTAPRDVSGITSMYIDGDMWLADRGGILRVFGGNSEGWEAEAPGDEVLRTAPSYELVASGTEQREGAIYAFDAANDRLIALSKVNGTFLGQYRLAGGSDAWADMRDFYVERSIEGQPDAIVWISEDAVNRAVLESVTGPPAAPGPTDGAAATEDAQ
jgi:hypothetical protein